MEIAALLRRARLRGVWRTCARQRSFVAYPVANVVKAVLNVPVLADDAEQHAGIGPVPVERGQSVGGVFG